MVEVGPVHAIGNAVEVSEEVCRLILSAGLGLIHEVIEQCLRMDLLLN